MAKSKIDPKNVPWEDWQLALEQIVNVDAIVFAEGEAEKAEETGADGGALRGRVYNAIQRWYARAQAVDQHMRFFATSADNWRDIVGRSAVRLLGLDSRDYEIDWTKTERISPPNLGLAQRARIQEVREKTQDLFAAGYMHAGYVFSLAPEHRVYYLELVKEAGQTVTYPVRVTVKHGRKSAPFADQASLRAFCTAVRVRVHYILAEEARLIFRIRGADSKYKLKLVVDDRS